MCIRLISRNAVVVEGGNVERISVPMKDDWMYNDAMGSKEGSEGYIDELGMDPKRLRYGTTCCSNKQD